MARPSTYSKKLALEIANRIAEGGSLQKIAQDESMPSMRTMLRWVQGNKDFGELLAHARISLADFWFFEAIEISDEQVADAAAASRQRTRVAARQHAASRLNPRRYGEKLAVGGAGPELDPLEISASQNEVARRIAYVFQVALRKRAESEKEKPND